MNKRPLAVGLIEGGQVCHIEHNACRKAGVLQGGGRTAPRSPFNEISLLILENGHPQAQTRIQHGLANKRSGNSRDHAVLALVRAKRRLKSRGHFGGEILASAAKAC